MEDPGEQFVATLTREQLEALVEAMFLVAFSDGEYSAAERRRFAHSVDMLTAGRLRGEPFEHLMRRVTSAREQRGRERCIAQLSQRLDTPRLREVALILASDIAAADGTLHAEERAVLHAMARAFGVAAEAQREVIDGFPGRPDGASWRVHDAGTG